jgi:glutamate-1-semialdehyde aminotransferase
MSDERDDERDDERESESASASAASAPAVGRHDRSIALARRAAELFPGGNHLSGRPLLADELAPRYFARGSGCTVRDVDGFAYVDYLLAYGAVILGYAHHEVDQAAITQLQHGSLLSLNHELHVDFMEALLRRLPGHERVVFLKTGSEATTAALRIARRATGRRMVARCGYHGWHVWCLPLDAAVPAGLAAEVLEFDARRPATLRALLDAHPQQLAAVIVAPEMVTPLDAEALHELAAVTRKAGAVFILDEVKTGFRIAPGSLHARLGLQPDLVTVSKALGNGWPVAAVVGSRAVMDHAAGLHVSATYHGDTASMAAAMATMDILERDRVYDHVWRLGERLIAGLQAAATRHRVPARAYGEPLPPMPFLRFEHDDAGENERLKTRFYAEMIARGFLLHPRHLWFISAAHTDEIIDRTLDAADAAFAQAAAVGA